MYYEIVYILKQCVAEYYNVETDAELQEHLL